MRKRPLTKASFAFAEPPTRGLAVSIAEQRYDLVDVEPYQRKDGAQSELSVWLASCRACGNEFLHKTSRLRFPEARNCAGCRKGASS